MSRAPEQTEFDFPTWGGERKGAGRPRRTDEQPHAAREPVARRFPVHVTIRLAAGRSLRTYDLLRVLRKTLRALHARSRDFRVCHYSLQDSHLHLIAEADGPGAFVSGTRSLCIRVARGLNRALGRKGRLFGDRHHRHILKTPREVRNALAYVILNHVHHAAQRGVGSLNVVDSFSSAAWFDGWSEEVAG